MVLLVLLLQSIGRIRRSVSGLLEVAGKVGANTANIPQLEATAPVLALIVEEAVVQDGYMNALTDGYGQSHEHGHADRPDRRARRRRDRGARGRADPDPARPGGDLRRASRTLHSALEDVESEHLRPLEGAVKAINAQFDVILGALPGIARKAAVVAERRPR